MNSSVVLKQEFGGKTPFSRMDAEFINTPIRPVEQALSKRDGGRIGGLVQERLPALTKSSDPDFVERYIEITSIDSADGLAFPDELRTADLPSRAKYRVQAADILVANVRPNRGAVALLSTRSEGHLASSGFTLLRLRPESGFSPAYVFSFLKTPFGREQLVRRNRGSMYPAVSPGDVQDVWIPSPDQATEATVLEHVNSGLEKQDEFYARLGEAKEFLAAFLAPYGAPPSPLESEMAGANVNIVGSNDVFGVDSALRFDAEFFREEYDKFDAHCQSLGPTFLLGAHYKLGTGRALTRGDALIPYMKQGCLTNVGINWSAVASEPGKIAKGAPRIANGDILLACTAHEIYYVGRKVDLVRNMPASVKGKTTCVADLMVIRPRTAEFDTAFGAYVAAFLRHPAGLHQVQRCIRGLRGGHVYRSDLSNYVRIPVPSDEWLRSFEALTSLAESARNDAKDQMGKAFRAVEAYVTTLT